MEKDVRSFTQMIEESFIVAFEEMQRKVHDTAIQHGFWDDAVKRNGAEAIALMHSELSEALEAMRQPELLPDRHCPQHDNLAIELADCIIRIMDYAAGNRIDVARALIAKMKFNESRPYKHGKGF